MATVYYWTPGETASFTATLEREIADDVFAPEDLSPPNVTGVTLTLYKPNGQTYKSGAAVTVVDAAGGGVKYIGVAADTQQGTLTGRFWVSYADGSTHPFPKPKAFQVRVSQ